MVGMMIESYGKNRDVQEGNNDMCLYEGKPIIAKFITPTKLCQSQLNYGIIPSKLYYTPNWIML